MAAGDFAIEVNDLSKHFGEKVAVDRINFEVKRSEVFGFLGPNGAGKTTTIKMLTTLLPLTSGRATVLGLDLKTEGKKIRERIGVVQQQDSYDQGLNVETSMDLYGIIWDVPKKERRSRIESLIEKFGMEEYRKSPTSELSGGQRRRVQVAREFIHDMDVLFLDEPTAGLDPLARRVFLDFFKEKVKAGLTIFFTTHILEEAEYLCDRIAVINDGKIIETDSPSNLKRRFGGGKAVEFRLLEGVSSDLFKRFSSVEGVNKLVLDEASGVYNATTSKPEHVIPELYRLADKLNLNITSIYIAETTLEDAFISLVKNSSGESSNKHGREGMEAVSNTVVEEV
ncbi:MAG TPA: ABC transporter ATP-binding protein [Nitrososphaerales archaeon]